MYLQITGLNFYAFKYNSYFPPGNLLQSLGSISQCWPYIRIIWGGINMNNGDPPQIN